MFNRRKMLDMLKERFDENLLILSADGVASLVVLKVVNDNDELETDTRTTRGSAYYQGM